MATLIKDLSSAPDSICNLTLRTSELPSSAEVFRWIGALSSATNSDYESRKLLVTAVKGNPSEASDVIKSWSKPVEVSALLQGGWLVLFHIMLR